MPIKTHPLVEPVTDAELQAHLGMTNADFAARAVAIHANLASARQQCESVEGADIALITQTWTYHAAGFHQAAAQADGFNQIAGQISLRAPLQSVTYVKYIDSAGVEQTIDPADYQIDRVAHRILPAYGKTWPIARYQANAVEIEYLCGFGNAPADVPLAIQQAIKLIVGQNERYQTVVEGGFRPLDMPNAAKQLLAIYRDYRGIE